MAPSRAVFGIGSGFPLRQEQESTYASVESGIKGSKWLV